MYKLYGRRGAGSAAVEAMLTECGVPFDYVEVQKEGDGSIPAWFLKINRRGEVPALELPDGSIMTESAAMMIYLADVVPQKSLAPGPNTPERAQYLRWIAYLAAAVYTSDLRMYYPERYSTDASHAGSIKAKAIIDLNGDFDVLALGLGEGPFILGQQMTAADIYAGMLLSWSDDFPRLMAKHPRLKALYEAVASRPAIRKVWDANAMP